MRTIKNTAGETFQGNWSVWQDKKDCVVYREGFPTVKTEISRDHIVSDRCSAPLKFWLLTQICSLRYLPRNLVLVVVMYKVLENSINM